MMHRASLVLCVLFVFAPVVLSRRKFKRKRRKMKVVMNADGRLNTRIPVNEDPKWLTKPDGVNFIWEAPSIGHVIDTGVASPIAGKTVTLTVASTKPRIFVVENFMSEDEMEELKRYAVDPENAHAMRQSTVDVERSFSSTRTSSNAWDMHSANAMRMKRRAFKVLRLRYNESMADAIQVLRYNIGEAYITHTDQYAVGTQTTEGDHNFDPRTGGANRLATMLLYLSDVEMGGQTVFPLSTSAPLRDPDPVALERATRLFPNPDSWQAEAVKTCYSKFSVYPKKGDAILFYGQHEDGSIDHAAMHGGCPVLEGQKWAANLWVWNDCQYGTACDLQPYDHPGWHK